MFKDLPTTFQGLHSIFKDHLLCGNSGGVGEEVGGGGGGGGGGGVISSLQIWKIQGGGGVLLSENPFGVGYGYFLEPHIYDLYSVLNN